MNYSAKVTRVENGFTVEVEDSYVDSSGVRSEVRVVITVFEDQGDEEDGRKAFVDMVWFLAEHFGFPYDKWNNNNLDINFNGVGHKNEPEGPKSK